MIPQRPKQGAIGVGNVVKNLGHDLLPSNLLPAMIDGLSIHHVGAFHRIAGNEPMVMQSLLESIADLANGPL